MHRRPVIERAATNPKPVTALRGVGESLASRLRALGVETTEDLLFLLPQRYEDRTRDRPAGRVAPGTAGGGRGRGAIDRGRVSRPATDAVQDRGWFRLSHSAVLSFHRAATERVGARLRASAASARRAADPWAWKSCIPNIGAIDPQGAAAPEDHLTPIYPLTEGVTQGRLRLLVGMALDQTAAGDIEDWLPATVLADSRLPSLREALLYVHRPPADAPVDLLLCGRHPAQRRLAFEELLAHQLSLKLLRQRIQSDPGWPLAANSALKAGLLAALPFRLTKAQQRALLEIERDLGLSKPMLRLVQGDVGCGKTLVAALAATQAVQAGRQAVLMAPTELLADQHAQNFRRWFEPLGVAVALLTGRQSGRTRSAALEGIREGHASIVVGTHALFQESVEFSSLALVIVDEQHRFGVHQRLSLREKGALGGHQPHQLIMTATPIPRTLAMTAYADLDVSVIDELPPGRTPVKTVVLADVRRDEVVQRIRTACLEGRQAYWVCPLIDESEEMPYQAAEETAAALAAALPELQVGLVHGRMPSRAKEGTMRRFKEGKIQLLVATTVIEVGVDVPNATLMVIENAERLGLAQLHQLRGRVGRGQHASSCLLLYRAPLSPLARRAPRGDARYQRRLRGGAPRLGTARSGRIAGHAPNRPRPDARGRFAARCRFAAPGADRRGVAAARLAAACGAADPPLGGSCRAIRPRRVE